jgi:hypothetical protein
MTCGSAFQRLAWSNLAAQSAEQVALAATPLIAVLAFGAQEGATGALQTAQTLPFLLMAGAEALRVLSLLALVALMACGALTLPLLARTAWSAQSSSMARRILQSAFRVEVGSV